MRNNKGKHSNQFLLKKKTSIGRTCVYDEHPLKVPEPIFVTKGGINTYIIDEHPLKASLPIELPNLFLDCTFIFTFLIQA